MKTPIDTENHSDTPPTIEWDSRGLMRGITYRYRPDSSIDWRAMIEPEFLAIQREYEAELKARFEVDDLKAIDRTKVPDRQLLILLGGIKRLLWLRGYESLIQRVDSITPEKAVCTCTITFAPNYETRMRPVTYSDVASASYANTSGDIPQMFLEATAANRALVRCVRGFLNINIVGKDEIGPSRFVKPFSGQASSTLLTATEAESTPPSTGFQGKDTLAKRCHEKGLTFEKVKEASITKYKAELKGNPEEWKSFDDIASLDAYTLLDKLSHAGAKKSKKE